MALSEEQRQAIGNALQAIVTNGSSLSAEEINQITARILSASDAPTLMPVTNAQVQHHHGIPGGVSRRRSRAASARNNNGRVKLRPLNAFICFRSYYSPIFAGLTQKIKSGLMRQLWENDSWKHFWAMEAKAYSDIRDAHLNKINLDQFLAETVGILGVIPADEYLVTMGWKLVTGESADYRLVKVDPAAGTQNANLSTNLSAADIVKHCYEVGLVERPVPRRADRVAAGTTMAFAAHPLHPKIPIIVQTPRLTGNFTDEHGFFGEMTAEAEDQGAATENDQNMTEVVEDAVEVGSSTSYGENLSIETATADVQGALEAYPDEYPYNLHFHPAVDKPIIVFDPSLVQDDFDPFNIADFVNFDL